VQPNLLRSSASYSDSSVAPNLDGWRFPVIADVNFNRQMPFMFAGRDDPYLSSIASRGDGYIRSLICPKLLFGIRIRSLGCIGRSYSSFNSALRLASSGNLFSPLSDSHIAIENDGKESQPLHKQPYSIPSLCAVVFGPALGFCALWLMHEGDYFYFGLLLLLIGVCIFVYGLDGIFDVMEINTQGCEGLPSFSQKPLSEINELASNVIHVRQISIVRG
jgi:hypothetical protein